MESIDGIAGVQIVRVISECRLLDTQSTEHVYWRRDGLGLAQGYYVTRRGRSEKGHVFNEDAEFRGPYRSREDAWAAMVELVARMAARGARRTEFAHA